MMDVRHVHEYLRSANDTAAQILSVRSVLLRNAYGYGDTDFLFMHIYWCVMYAYFGNHKVY